MSDEEILVARNRSYFSREEACQSIIALADEALARGAALAEAQQTAQIERMKRQATEGIAEQMAKEYDHCRECVTQLEKALRFYGEPMTYKAGAGCEYWLVPIEQDRGEKARAALAAGKPASET